MIKTHGQWVVFKPAENIFALSINHVFDKTRNVELAALSRLFDKLRETITERAIQIAIILESGEHLIGLAVDEILSVSRIPQEKISRRQASSTARMSNSLSGYLNSMETIVS